MFKKGRHIFKIKKEDTFLRTQSKKNFVVFALSQLEDFFSREPFFESICLAHLGHADLFLLMLYFDC